MIEEAEVCYKTVSSEYVRKIVLMNSQQLRLPTQALHKVRPVSILAEKRQAQGPSPLTEDLLAADGCEGESTFFRSVAYDRLTILYWMALYPCPCGYEKGMGESQNIAGKNKE